MARKSGYSHALAALLSLLVGKLLVSYLHPYFPMVFDPLERKAQQLLEKLSTALGVEWNSDFFVPLLVAILIAFIWGLLYHRVRHER